jgi:hypothetical protein
MEQKTINDPHARVLQELHDTYLAKNADYGNSFAALYAEFGPTYAIAHIAEKTARIRALLKHTANVSGESMRDSLMDLANYAILTVMEIDGGDEEPYTVIRPATDWREAAERWADLKWREVIDNPRGTNHFCNLVDAFLAGASWLSEQNARQGKEES